MMAFREYLKRIRDTFLTGRATEHTYRPALKDLVESLEKGIDATNEPRRIECGAPDFIITRSGIPIGYIETKDIGASLDEVERTDQLKRYRKSLPNLILTDYLVFRWYGSGELRQEVRIARMLPDGKIQSLPDSFPHLQTLFRQFLENPVPTVASPYDLALRMASKAQFIREIIEKTFEAEGVPGPLHDQFESFRRVLLHDLTPVQFSDMYAQTICYGLFAARIHAKEGERFTREHAAFDLPKTNPFLRKLFTHIAGPDLDDRIAWIVDDLAELLDKSDMPSILKDFGKGEGKEDPVVHFYETFLSRYDPKMREIRGVYYTPEPVVAYIVRSVDRLLNDMFKLKKGLGDDSKITISQGKKKVETHRVHILDPATGTGTFLYDVIARIHESFQGNEGLWPGYVSAHLLPRLHGFELLMAPYAIAHLKLGLELKRLGYDFRSDERLSVYLTNSLEEAHEFAAAPLFTRWLAEEANNADKVKREYPIMVVLGNPPYSVNSANTGEWISGLLKGRDSLLREKTQNYFEVDGQPLNEQNPKNLHDDYVKFIRFAQWRIERTGHGILAFVTNHGYLDNPTFRGMRQSLMTSFDDLYLLDLHGNSKKRERTPDGKLDENVFDIQQGVAIGIFVKRQTRSPKEKGPRVFHADLWGMREEKYQWLSTNEVVSTSWTAVSPTAPFYLFIPQEERHRAEYEKGLKITDVFLTSSTGVKTHRDHFVFDFDETILRKRIQDFVDLSIPDSEIRERYDLHDTRDWKLSERRRALANDPRREDSFTKCLYRPFDTRSYFHHKEVVDRPRDEVMRHMLEGKNVGLITVRQVAEGIFNHSMVTKAIIDNRFTNSNKGTAFIFPLYLYETENDFSKGKKTKTLVQHPNLSPEFLEYLSQKLTMQFVSEGKGNLTKTFGPEDVFHNIYAVLHSSTYRSRYAEFLKIDFPRAPFTSDSILFRDLCGLGDRLVKLHLLEVVPDVTTRFPVPGDNRVDRVRYTESPEGDIRGCVWINGTQYFEGIPLEVWNFHIGGYKVLEKWLKDRKGRVLSHEELEHYRKVVTVLSETMKIQAKIDEVIGEWPLE